MIIKKILELLWPETCPFCGKISKTGICERCRIKIKKLEIKEPKCMRCGKPVRYEEQEFCHDCMQYQHYFDQGVSVWRHVSLVRESIYRYKFYNQRAYKVWYAKEIQRVYENKIKRWAPDFIVPVPLHKRKRKKRGFNQAEILAVEVGKLLGIPCYPKLILRKKYTKPQKNLGRRERKWNLKGNFAIRSTYSDCIKGKKILIIDDIYTTGSTMDEMARILKENGAEKVYYVTLSTGTN